MSDQKDILRSNNISGDTGVTALNRSVCVTLVYRYGHYWDNGKWNIFGSDLFDVKGFGNHHNIIVSSIFVIT